MTTHPKWDIVEDVVDYAPASQVHEHMRPIRARLERVATSAMFGAVLMTGIVALPTVPVPLHVTTYGLSETVPLVERSPFVRPRGVRSADSETITDTQFGMSTRRLGELHRKLFAPDTSAEEELTGHYDFL